MPPPNLAVATLPDILGATNCNAFTVVPLDRGPVLVPFSSSINQFADTNVSDPRNLDQSTLKSAVSVWIFFRPFVRRHRLILN